MDDMLSVVYDIAKIKKLKNELSRSFVMKDLSLVRRILGVKLLENEGLKGIFAHQLLPSVNLVSLLIFFVILLFNYEPVVNLTLSTIFFLSFLLL